MNTVANERKETLVERIKTCTIHNFLQTFLGAEQDIPTESHRERNSGNLEGPSNKPYSDFQIKRIVVLTFKTYLKMREELKVRFHYSYFSHSESGRNKD